MKFSGFLVLFFSVALFAHGSLAAPAPAPARNPAQDDTYTSNEIIQKGAEFFGVATEMMAKVVEKVFAEHGRPNGYIAGNEGSGAFVVGLRYGEGQLYMKGNGNSATHVYWQIGRAHV